MDLVASVQSQSSSYYNSPVVKNHGGSFRQSKMARKHAEKLSRKLYRVEAFNCIGERFGLGDDSVAEPTKVMGQPRP